LISVNGYWDYKFRNVSLDANDTMSDSSTELQTLFTRYSIHYF
jgi:hypothetical protein